MRTILAAAISFLVLGGICLAADADAAIKRSTHIPPQLLAPALQTLVKERDIQLVYRAELIGDRRTAGASGELTAVETLQQLLRETGLTYQYLDETTLTIVERSGAISTDLTSPSRPAGSQQTSSAQGAQQQSSDGNQLRLAQADAAPSQVGEEQASQAVQEIVVTAQKRTQSVLDVPMSINALDAATIEKKGVQDVLDLSFTVPGFTVREEGPGRQRLFMRGIGNNSGSDVLTSAYMDEAPINTVSSGQALNSIDMLGIRMTDLERVEVLRGPQGTLYGSGAMSGTVRFITKDPALDRWSAKGELSLSSTEDGDPSQEVTAVVNAPIVNDVFGLRLAATVGSLGGWIDQPSASSSENIEDINNQDLVDVRLKALWQISDSFSAKATAVVHRNESDVGTSISDEDGVFRPGFDPTARIPFTDNSELFNLTLSYQMPFAELLSSSTYIDQQNRNLYGFKDSGRTLFPTFESIGDVHKSAQVFTQEVRLTSADDEAFSWIVGAFYRDRKGRQQEVDQNRFMGFEFPGEFDTEWDSTAWAVFGDATVSVGERFDVGAGMRYFEDQQGVINHLIPGFTRKTETFDATTWRVFATYDLTERVSAYANVATGFRSGGYVLNPTDTTPAFGPETLLSYELGVKGSAFGGRLTGDVAVFTSDYKDMLQRALRFVGTGFIDLIDNVGEASVKGIDANFQLRLTDRLTLDFSGSISDGEIEKVDPERNPAGALPGDPLDYVPDYSYSLGAEYAFDWAPEAPGFVRVDYYARDKITALDRGTNANLMESDKLGFLGARLGAELGNWSLQLFGENLLDEYGSIDPWQDWGITLRPRPRTFGISVSADFD